MIMLPMLALAPAAPLIVPSHTSASNVKLPLPPLAESAVDLRPDAASVADDSSVRALPVALPVAMSGTDIR